MNRDRKSIDIAVLLRVGREIESVQVRLSVPDRGIDVSEVTVTQKHWKREGSAGGMGFPGVKGTGRKV